MKTQAILLCAISIVFCGCDNQKSNFKRQIDNLITYKGYNCNLTATNNNGFRKLIDKDGG